MCDVTDSELRGKRFALFVVGLLLTCAPLTLRLINHEADPPVWLSCSAGIFSDEGIYAGDARSAATNNHWNLGSFHTAILSPSFFFYQLAFFHTLWASLRTGRLLNELCGILTVIFMTTPLERAARVRAGLFFAILTIFCAPFVLYNRLALMETPVVLCLSVAFACLSVRTFAEKRVKEQFVIAAAFFVGLAIATKGIAWLAFPAFAVAACRLGKREAATFLGAFVVIYGLYAAFVLHPHAAELARMNRYYLYHQYLPHSWAGVVGNLKRGLFTGERDGVIRWLLTLAPVVTIAGFAGIVQRWKKMSATDLLIALWILVPIAAWLFLSYTPSRYYVIILPALAASAGMYLATLPKRWGYSLVALSVVIDLVLLSGPLLAPRYTIRDGSAKLEAMLPPGSRIAGQFAPELGFDTKFETLYVQPGLANDVDPLGRYKIDYVLITRSQYWDSWWDSQYPALRNPSNLIGTVRIGPYDVDVYAVPGPKTYLALREFSEISTHPTLRATFPNREGKRVWNIG